MRNPKHCVVIGGGFGGIAAALRARKKGYTVTLIDRCPMLGGRAQVYHKNGYRHDAGPTVITAPFLFDELFELFDRKREDYVQFIPLKLWYRFRYANGDTFDYSSSKEDLLQAIQAIEPDDINGYQQLLQASKNIYETGFEQLADQPFHKLSNLLRYTPKMLQLRSDQSVWQLVCKHLKSEKLRQAFSIQPLLVGGNPFDTTSIYNLIHFLERKDGIHFAQGGTGALVDALEQLMQETGINLSYNETVTQIHTNRQHMVSGISTTKRSLDCDMIISNADPAHLYQQLLPKASVAWSARTKSRMCKKSMGLFVLFFGTTKTYPKIAHHTISLGPRYQGLLDDIFNKKVVADDCSIYLHRPTATDPSFAPPDCDSFYALVPVPNLQGKQDWRTIGEQFKEQILDNLENTLLPDLRAHLDHVFYKTPKDFQDDFLSPDGAGFSIAPVFYQSAWFRYHNLGEGPKNLYLVGAGTHPGAGLPGVLCSAKVLEHLLPDQNSSLIQNQNMQDTLVT